MFCLNDALVHWLTAKKGVHQFRFFLSNMHTPMSMTMQGYSSQLWCTHWGQEEPKLVYTLFCCKLVGYKPMKQNMSGGSDF